MSETPYAIEQMTLYFSTVTAGATPTAANLVGEFRGEPVTNITHASALWRGQDRFAKNAVLHDADASATIPGFTFDSSEVLTKFLNGTHTNPGSTSILHGSAPHTISTNWASHDKAAKNTKPLLGEWLIQGLKSDTGKVIQILYHNAFLTGIGPTHGRTDFGTLDLNLTLLADAAGDVFSVFKQT